MPLKSAPWYGTSCHSRPSFSAMRCISAMSKPAGPSLLMNSKGGSGKAAPTFKAGAPLALRAPNTPVASNGKAASKWRRFIVRFFRFPRWIENSRRPAAAIARGEQRVERARRLAFAAFRPARFGRRHPIVDVEVQPACGRTDKTLQEQRAGDRSGESRRRVIVDIGDLGIEHGFVGRPKRQPPRRIVFGGGTARKLGRQILVVGVKGRQLRPKRGAGRPGERAEVDEEVGLFLVR